MKWPLQSECISFYGNPVKANGQPDPAFERNHIVRVDFPFKAFYGVVPLVRYAVHEKCADASQEWLLQVWKNSGKNQDVIDKWGMSKYGGSFTIRPKRSSRSLSMHSFGCAFDFDPGRNGYKVPNPNFRRVELFDAIVKPFLDLGGVWGGSWKDPCDGMHFQFARPG